MLSVPETTNFTWRLSVKTAPEKPRFIIVGLQTAKDGDQTKIHPEMKPTTVSCCQQCSPFSTSESV